MTKPLRERLEEAQERLEDVSEQVEEAIDGTFERAEDEDDEE